MKKCLFFIAICSSISIFSQNTTKDEKTKGRLFGGLESNSQWYLNDVEDGGETEFCGDFTIRPEVGKLIFFPASWCYPHRGKMPISGDKYIITGWLHINNIYL